MTSLRNANKKAATLLRIAFDDPSHFPTYQALEESLGLPKIPYTKEALADRYHEHLRVALIHIKEDQFLPHISHLDSLSNEPFLPIDLYLDNLRSAHNVGSIIRTTEAMRLGTIHFSEKTPALDHPKIIKTAMGTHALVPHYERSSLANLRRPLIALETSENACSLYDYTFPPSFSLLLGNEEYGLSKGALDAANSVVKIPLYGSKNSLNVASAFTAVAFEIRRQFRLHLEPPPSHPTSP